jgi:hypothetical protein
MLWFRASSVGSQLKIKFKDALVQGLFGFSVHASPQVQASGESARA